MASAAQAVSPIAAQIADVAALQERRHRIGGQLQRRLDIGEREIDRVFHTFNAAQEPFASAGSTGD